MGICLPPASTTRDTLSALFNSKVAEVTPSPTGRKRTLVLAANVEVLGVTSASMVYCSTSMVEAGRFCGAGAAGVAIQTSAAASGPATQRRKLRYMSGLSFQDFLNDSGGSARGRGSAPC